MDVSCGFTFSDHGGEVGMGNEFGAGREDFAYP